MKSFQNKVAWITGASSGLGAALAAALARQGARLILSARRVERLEELRADILSKPDTAGAKVSILPLDLTDHGSIPSVAEAAREVFGRIDLLINNAGVSQRSLLEDTDYPVLYRLMDTNFLGTAHLTTQVLPGMISQGGGHIVAVTSLMGKFGFQRRTGYCASKHALHGFFESLNTEVWKQGIGITLIVPGFIRTEMAVSALTGSGQAHGILDPRHAKAKPPEYYAPRILRAIRRGRFEYYVALDRLTRMALIVRKFLPAVQRAAARRIGIN